MNRQTLSKIMLVLLVICLGWSLSQPPKADGVYVGGWSKHFNAEKWEERGWKVNSNQNFLAVEVDGYIAGHYTNSFGDSTYLAAKYIPIYSGHDIAFGGYLGATHGYKFCDGEARMSDNDRTCGAAIPEIRYTKYQLQPSLLIMKNGVALTFKWEFK
jgi:hypothetical protein